MKVLKNFFKIISLTLVAFILSFNLSSTYVMASSGGVVENVLRDAGLNILKMFLTVNGVITRSPLDITGFSSAGQAAALEVIEQQIDLGNISESDGKINFNQTAMTALYDVLGSNPNSRIISDFSSYDPYVPDEYSGYSTENYINAVNADIHSLKSSGKNYVMLTGVYKASDNWVHITYHSYRLEPTVAYVYFNESNTSARFYNSNGQTVTCADNTISLTWRSNNTVYDFSQYASSTYALGYTPALSANIADVYYNFPFYKFLRDGHNAYTTYFSNCPLIICKDAVAGNAAVNKTSGTYFFNNYNSYSIESNTFYQNDWTKIYNSYVNNVNNTYVDKSSETTLNSKEVYNIMDTYIQNIYQGIEDGDTEIDEKIDYINEWLSKIYSNTNTMINRLDEIIQIIGETSTGGTSGASCVWTDEEITELLDILSTISDTQVEDDADIIGALEYLKTKILNIETNVGDMTTDVENISDNTDTIVTTLDTQLSRLATIVSKLDTIISKMGNNVETPTIDPSVIPDIENIDIEDLLDTVYNPFAIASQVIQTVIPVCYILLVPLILNQIKAEPMAPKWEIPIKFSNPVISVNEKLVLDLSDYDDLAVFVRAFVLMAFAVGLCFLSIDLVRKILQIF